MAEQTKVRTHRQAGAKELWIDGYKLNIATAMIDRCSDLARQRNWGRRADIGPAPGRGGTRRGHRGRCGCTWI